ncbi:hypothetical protein BDQ12DRAFT_719479 [Crucibulum laeve]|uniref:Phytocyanin domain-containing protein n=1 Tax=Crucibulum laeve TaxID=68775 RepID=A0A5C3MN74_9AGAR|nr:hypothetical protein BDQ12DRAFT_719479 [Crucibulum laeve]
MVFITPFIGAAALLSGFASALPRPDSAINEPAVSAPNGTPITDTAGVASQTASSVAASSVVDSSSQATTTAVSYGSSDSYGSSGSYGSSNYGSQADNSWSSVTTSAWQAATTSTTAWGSYSSPSYGSGNSNWGGSGYNDCVNQCIASFGSPMQAYTPTATVEVGSSGSGATHTVIVAPTQGVLRYVPFAVNASVGDTIKFMWGANNHTVTKSSALLPCNKSADGLFTSGTQNKDFVFTQVVNDTNPTFFYCGTPTHCQKGMFGIINPPNAFAAPSSVSNMMQSISSSNPDVSAYAASTSMQTANNTQASKWGGNIDMSSLPDWSHQYVAENVLYTRSFLASNPEVLKEDGSVDLSSGSTTPLMIPQDLSNSLNAAAATTSSASSSSAPVQSASSTAAPAATSSGTTENLSNGASSLASPKTIAGVVVVIATFFLL